MTWACSVCGEVHEGLPRHLAFDAPVYWDGGRGPDDRIDSDLCRWTDDDGNPAFFIRGLITLRVVDDDEDDFRFGLWSSLSEKSFERVLQLWDDPARVAEPAYFGWLSNSIPGYPETLSLPLDVYTRSLEYRPEFVLHEGEHPLVRDQREGITLARVRELAELTLHA